MGFIGRPCACWWRLTAVVGVVLVAGLLIAVAAQGSTRPVVTDGAGPYSWSSRIESPTRGTVRLRSSVRVVVAVGPGVRSFRAKVGDRVVSGAFRRADGGAQRAATLRVGGALRYGRNTLYVRTAGTTRSQRWFTQSTFVVARPVSGLIQAVRAEPGCGTASRLTVSLTRPDLRVTVWLNRGRALTLRGGATRSVMLNAAHGVRPGTNRVLVRVLDMSNGGYSDRTVQLPTPSSAPIAGARTAARGTAGRVIHFSAASSVTSEPGMRLRYHWQLVSRPRGSRARLRAANTAHPYVLADRPGRYTAQLTVDEVPVAGAHTTALLCLSESSTVKATVAVAPATPPIGLPIDTIAEPQSNNVGVQIGATGTPGSAFYAAPDLTKALQVVVLDRTTLVLVRNASYSNDVAGATALRDYVKSLPDSDLVIITRPSGTLSNAADPTGAGDPAATALLNQALGAIGVSPAGTREVTQDQCAGPSSCSNFSALGVPGIPIGQGQLNPGLPGIGVAFGDLHGYLRQSLQPNRTYTYVNTERVPFTTGSGDANPAVVTVGSDEPGSEVRKSTYTSDKLGGAGFFVVALNAGNLQELGQVTVSATGTNPSDLSQMAADLGTWTANGTDPKALVIVRSIGNVGRNPSEGAAWDKVAALLQQLGGSKYYFNAVSGNNNLSNNGSSFAQVGPAGTPGYPSPWTQVASQQATGNGQLSGLLARNSLGQFYPSDPYPIQLNDPARPLAGSLSGIMSMPQSPWPDRDSDSDKNVIACIAKHIYPSGPLPLPIEDSYTNENLKLSWDGFASDLYNEKDDYQALQSHKDCASFTETDFNTVRDQLANEWHDVAVVWSMIDNMQKPLLGDHNDAAEIASVAAKVNEDVGTGAQTAHYDGLGISADVLELLALLPGVDAVGAPFEALAMGLDLAGQFDVNDNGSNPLADINSKAVDLGANVAKQLTTQITGLDEIGAILVSNWRMLQLAGQNAAGTTNAAANWAWKKEQPADAANDLLLAVRRQAFEALVPARYKLYRLEQGDAKLTSPTDYLCQAIEWNTYAKPPAWGLSGWKPFETLPSDNPGTVTAYWSVARADSPEYWVYSGTSDWINADHDATLPSTSLLHAMFTSDLAENGITTPLFTPMQFALDAYPSTDAPGQGVTHSTITKYSVTTHNNCRTNGP